MQPGLGGLGRGIESVRPYYRVTASALVTLLPKPRGSCIKGEKTTPMI